jgi:hypothetical protein
LTRFETDGAWTRAVRDAILVPALYTKLGAHICLDSGRLSTFLQNVYAIDTVLLHKDQGVIGVEEKIVRWPGQPYSALTLETMSCSVPGYESDGWMRYGKADWLLYGCCQEDGRILCYKTDFLKLQDKFWPAEDSFPLTRSQQKNRTICRVVDIAWVRREVGLCEYMVSPPNEEAAKIVRQFNASHYQREAA